MNNESLQAIDGFRQTLQSFIDDLSDTQEKLLRLGKVTPDIVREIDYVGERYRFLNEEKDCHGRLIYESLFADPRFLEAWNSIDACWSKADEALANAEAGEDSEWFGGRLHRTIIQLNRIAEDLRKLGRGSAIIADQSQTPAASGEADGDGAADDTGLAWQARAIALMLDDASLTSEEIAEKVGMSRQTLYKDKLVREALTARNKQKRRDKSDRPTGTKDSKTGHVESW